MTSLLSLYTNLYNSNIKIKNILFYVISCNIVIQNSITYITILKNLVKSN